MFFERGGHQFFARESAFPRNLQLRMMLWVDPIHKFALPRLEQTGAHDLSIPLSVLFASYFSRWLREGQLGFLRRLQPGFAKQPEARLKPARDGAGGPRTTS